MMNPGHRHPRTTAVVRLADGNIGLCADVIELTPEEAILLGEQLSAKGREGTIVRPPSLQVVKNG